MTLESSHPSLYGAVTILVCLLFLNGWLKKPRDPRQPKQVPATIPIPFFGHIIGLLIWRNHYYTKVSQQWNLPIISLAIFGAKVYVSRSPELLYSVQRQPKSLSFWYFEAHFTALLGGLSKAGSDGCFRGVRPESIDDCPLIDCLKGVKAAVSSQGDLERMSQVALDTLHKGVHRFMQEKSGPIDLEAWIKREIMLATTDAVYGARNPFRDPAIVEGFWNFTDGALFVALPRILPRILAPKAVAGREAVFRAIEQYYESDGLQDASQLARARYSILTQSGMSVQDTARAECVFGIALNGNTAPTAFWVVWHIFSDAVVLARIRKELEKFVSTELNGKQGVQTLTLDLRGVKENQYLQSVIQETLRYRARGTGPRMVLEDVTLSGDDCEYLLEKDSTLILAHEGMHYNKAVWGTDAESFVSDRFLPGDKAPPTAFRGFGGGANLCPGKSFAMSEIASLVAMLVTQADMEAVGGWNEPGRDASNMARENPPPLRKVMVNVAPRVGMEDVVWKYVL
ncbi:hypothetical protein SLS60_009623 [Paraconiothyrium brasiliense]|uniref:Cytochrome P450 n=1 Tax=Paraconiothyrium brasiliense TaxID=300254 RepID=A0ABR3QV56_9PLEO